MAALDDTNRDNHCSAGSGKLHLSMDPYQGYNLEGRRLGRDLVPWWMLGTAAYQLNRLDVVF